MPNIKLKPVDTTGQIRDSDAYDVNSTSDLINYCLRDGCLDSEYHISLRFQQLREVAMELINELYEHGGAPTSQQLAVIDVIIGGNGE